MKQIQYLRRWRCACCGLSMLCTMVMMGIVSYIVYTVFFRTPFSYIVQTQLIHRPLFERDQWLGMRVSADIYNPSFVPLMLQDVSFYVEFQSDDTSVKVLCDTGNYTDAIQAWTTTNVVFNLRADINDYDAVRIYTLTTQTTASVLVKGKLTLKLGNIEISQKMANYRCLQPNHFNTHLHN